MAKRWKGEKRVYPIVRVDSSILPQCGAKKETRDSFKVVKVVMTKDTAEKEVKRLNEMHGCDTFYFYDTCKLVDNKQLSDDK